MLCADRDGKRRARSHGRTCERKPDRTTHDTLGLVANQENLPRRRSRLKIQTRLARALRDAKLKMITRTDLTAVLVETRATHTVAKGAAQSSTHERNLGLRCQCATRGPRVERNQKPKIIKKQN